MLSGRISSYFNRQCRLGAYHRKPFCQDEITYPAGQRRILKNNRIPAPLFSQENEAGIDFENSPRRQTSPISPAVENHLKQGSGHRPIDNISQWDISCECSRRGWTMKPSHAASLRRPGSLRFSERNPRNPSSVTRLEYLHDFHQRRGRTSSSGTSYAFPSETFTEHPSQPAKEKPENYRPLTALILSASFLTCLSRSGGKS